MADRDHYTTINRPEPDAPARFNVICGSIVYANVSVVREELDGVKVLVLTGRRSGKWTVKEAGVTKMTPIPSVVPA